MNILQASNLPSAVEFIIPGRPTPLARPRFGKNRVFDCQKNRKLIVGISLREQMEGRPLFKESIFVFMDFYFDMPHNWSEKKRDLFLHKPYPSRIDLDNLIKFLADAGLSVLYDDDAIICGILARKLYGPTMTQMLIVDWYEYGNI